MRTSCSPAIYNTHTHAYTLTHIANPRRPRCTQQSCDGCVVASAPLHTDTPTHRHTRKVWRLTRMKHLKTFQCGIGKKEDRQAINWFDSTCFAHFLFTGCDVRGPGVEQTFKAAQRHLEQFKTLSE